MSNKEPVLSVSELVYYLKSVVENEPLFKNVTIVGELSNFVSHSSGHFYFSLKDDKSIIRAVMFRSQASKVLFKPENGQEVIVQGRLSVYEKNSDIQIYASEMSNKGLGDLYLRFENLKKEYETKGYFDPIHKKTLPKYPQRIGVITGDNSAALADMTRTLNERWPYAQQINYLSIVQGIHAAGSLVNAISKANEDKVDVIVLARGGGSIEDLWAFNEVPVFEAVFNSQVPVVSGVGHESDTTLVDFVSDYRAATPTAAMMYVTPNRLEVSEGLRDVKNKMYQSVAHKIRYQKQHLEQIQSKPFIKQPMSILDSYYYELDMVQNRITYQTRRFDTLRQHLDAYHQQLYRHIDLKFKMHHYALKDFKPNYTKAMDRKLKDSSQFISLQKTELSKQMEQRLFLKKMAFNDILNVMKHLNPFEIMQRGYGALFKDESPITSIYQVEVHDEIIIRLKDGKLKAKILERKIEDDRKI